MPYHECLQRWASKFNKIQYQYVPRMQNQIVDALVTIASMMDRPKEDETRPIVVEQKEESTYCMSTKEYEGKNGEVNGIQTSCNTLRIGRTRNLHTRMTN